MERKIRCRYVNSDNDDVVIVTASKQLFKSRSLGTGSRLEPEPEWGPETLTLDDGGEVESTDEPDTFKIVKTGELIRKIT